MSIEAYMTTSNVVDITLVDLPTAEMAQRTKDSLSYLDELWIVVEDSPTKTISWQSYIQNLKENLDIPIYLIFNSTYPFSASKLYSEHFSLSFLTEIPTMHGEVKKNTYEKFPLYYKEPTRVN